MTRLLLVWISINVLLVALELYAAHRRARALRPVRFPRALPSGSSAAIPNVRAGEAGTPGRHAPGAPHPSNQPTARDWRDFWGA